MQRFNDMQDMQAPKYFIQVPTYSIVGLGLSSTDKLVYGEILTMLNVTGVCFMSNAKIAEAIEVKNRAISRSISKLKEVGLINVELTYKGETKEVDKRYITLNESFEHLGGNVRNDTTPHVKNDYTPTSNSTIPHVKNDVDNILINRLMNIYINNSQQMNLHDSSLDELNQSQSYQSVVATKDKLGNDAFNLIFKAANDKNLKGDALLKHYKDTSKKLLDKNANTLAKAKHVLGITKQYADDSDYMKLANLLLNRIRRNDANFKQPNLQHWADDMRKLVELDKRSCKQVQKVILWSQKDSFWKSNILSAAKLRKQFTKLLIQSKPKGNVKETLPDWAKKNDNPEQHKLNKEYDINKLRERLARMRENRKK